MTTETQNQTRNRLTRLKNKIKRDHYDSRYKEAKTKCLFYKITNNLVNFNIYVINNNGDKFKILSKQVF